MNLADPNFRPPGSVRPRLSAPLDDRRRPTRGGPRPGNAGSPAESLRACDKVGWRPSRRLAVTASTTTDGVVTYNADLAVDNSDLAPLRPGMTATASIVTREARGVLLVPSSAFRFSPAQTASRRSFSLRDLFSPRIGRFGARDNGNGTAGEQGTRTLWVLRDGQPHRVQVQTRAIPTASEAEILSGLSEGDQVITGTANPNAKAASAEGDHAMERRAADQLRGRLEDLWPRRGRGARVGRRQLHGRRG